MEEESFSKDDSETDQMIETAEETLGEIHLDDQHCLDMAEVVRQYVLATVPIKPLCCEDCSGLCPECGTNLNREKCKCNTTPVDPRWGSLAGLLTERQE
jgi:uncharacterized protein